MKLSELITNIDLYLLIPIGGLMLGFELYERAQSKKQQRIDSQEIHVVFRRKGTQECKKLFGTLLRKDCSRSEVFGLINMNSKAGGRLNIEFMKTPAYFANLKRVQDDPSVDMIELELSDEELEFFPFEDWENADQ